MSAINYKLVLACLAMALIPPAVVLWPQIKEALPKPEVIDPYKAPGEVLHFTLPRCGACRAVQPTVNALRDEGFKIRTINMNSARSLAEKYNVHYGPTFVYVVDGEEVRREVGVQSPDELRRLWRSPEAWY
ncbi:MAG: thioredoxin family protein [Planctomycetota bacterium]|nr:thioredoxin family protein [Planctomycetota bacterium]